MDNYSSIKSTNKVQGTKRALLIIDVQNDFLPEAKATDGRVFSGSLAVSKGNDIIQPINRLRNKFDQDSEKSIVVLSQDFHPKGHVSFASSHHGAETYKPMKIHCKGLPMIQIMWPDHCVDSSEGSNFHPDLIVNKDKDKVIQKGVDPEVDSYSAFADNKNEFQTGLKDYLLEQGVGTIYVCGIATDYCVRFTALHGVADGFKTYVVLDACRGVSEETIREALQHMSYSGVYTTTIDEVPDKF